MRVEIPASYQVPKSVENGINQVTKNVKIHDKYANMC